MEVDVNQIDPALVQQILASADIHKLDRLPCGCEMGVVNDAFVIRPCSPDCKYWRYAQQQAKAYDKPMGYVWDRDQN